MQKSKGCFLELKETTETKTESKKDYSLRSALTLP